jgi:hypothetical protein
MNINWPRIALAAVAATIVDALYGFCVYGNVLDRQFAQYPAVYRPMAVQGAYMPFLFGGIFLAMIAASIIYAKGYEGGSGVTEGVRCGALIGVLAVGYSVIVQYAMSNIGRKLAVSMAAAALAEWVLAGIVIGLVYRADAGKK